MTQNDSAESAKTGEATGVAVTNAVGVVATTADQSTTKAEGRCLVRPEFLPEYFL